VSYRLAQAVERAIATRVASHAPFTKDEILAEVLSDSAATTARSSEVEALVDAAYAELARTWRPS
jgi:hypothetical protein